MFIVIHRKCIICVSGVPLTTHCTQCCRPWLKVVSFWSKIYVHAKLGVINCVKTKLGVKNLYFAKMGGLKYMQYPNWLVKNFQAGYNCFVEFQAGYNCFVQGGLPGYPGLHTMID